MAEGERESGGLLATLRRLLRSVFELAQGRLELFLLELKEERIRLFDALLLVAAGVACASMALVMLTFTLVVVFWEHRVLVMVILTLAYAAGASVALWTLRRRLHDWKAFAATLEQLEKDRACFQERN